MATWRWINPWKGDKIRQNAVEAARVAIDEIMAEGVQAAKSNHPGWQNQTGTAEGSIRMQPAQIESSAVRGVWGSFDVRYFIHLEMRDSTLRRAADNVYPKLPDRIRQNL